MDKELKESFSVAINDLDRVRTVGEEKSHGLVVDCEAVIGAAVKNGAHERNVGWFATAALMIKSQIGIGILCLPLTLYTLGIGPGIACYLVVSFIVSWSGYNIGQFICNHPDTYGVGDAVEIMLGGRVRIFAETLYCIRSGMQLISYAFLKFSSNAGCAPSYVAFAAAISCLLASFKGLDRISWIALVGVISIFTAVFTEVISVASQGRPAAAPKTGPWASDWEALGEPTFAEACSALATLTFAFAGVPTFFPIAAEMRDPRSFTKSLMTCQSTIIVVSLISMTVLYIFEGSYITSPAVGGAGPTLEKVVYGLALFGLLASTVMYTHLTAKYIFVHLLRRREHLRRKTFMQWAVWMACTIGVSLLAFAVASAIPVFDALVSLVGALCGTVLSFQLGACLWFYNNWSTGRANPGPRWYVELCIATFVLVGGTFLMGAGTYGSVTRIIDSYKEGGGRAAWSCANS